MASKSKYPVKSRFDPMAHQADLVLSHHLILSCKPNWSHLRSLSVLASRLAAAKPLLISVLVSNVNNVLKRVREEVARGLQEEPNANQSVVRILELTADTAELDVHFLQLWRTLIKEKPKPSAVILDGFQLSWCEIIRSEQSPPPIFQWMMAFSGGFLAMCGPTELGGQGDALREWIEDKAHDLEEWQRPVNGSIVSIPGMPKLLDRELYPQDLGEKQHKVVQALATMSKFVAKADGLLTNCAVEYDGPECLNSITSWIRQTNSRETFHVGPMIPFVPGTCQFSPLAMGAEIDAVPYENGKKATDFLDKTRMARGDRSVMYISFGTEHWPSSTELVDVLLSTLEMCNIPFIFTLACAAAVLPDNSKDYYESKGLGIFMRFGPQQAILAHKACGWFLTHGGANGTMEALCQGVPMIGWPFSVDQPLNITHLARTLDVAFELKEIRSGQFWSTQEQASTKIDRFRAELQSVFGMMAGHIGARKRANAERIGKTMSSVWSKDGRARNELIRFLELLVDAS